MIQSLRVVSVMLLAALAASLPTGCTQVQVAPGTRGEYKLGELQVFADRDFTTVYNAAKRALADRNLFLTQDDRLVIEAELKARDATDSLIVVKIKELGPTRTSVKIRYGLTGNLASAQELYQAIEKRL